MKALSYYLSLCALFSLIQAGAVEINGGTFNTTAPTSSDIPDWVTGWGASDVTGWDYVGTVNGASAVYLGNDWVLTAGHVGAGNFSLGGTSYTVVAGSAQGVTNSNGSAADLTMFKLTLAPNLPALTIATSPPVAASTGQAGSSVAMIGYGGGSESWGLNTVNYINYSASVGGYISNDFLTFYGTSSSPSYANNAFLIGGDSGGGDFIYNSSTQTWMLAGINEAYDGQNDSYMVQLSTYAPEISGLMAAPEPSPFAFFGLGLLTLIWKFRLRSLSRNHLPRNSKLLL